MAYNLLKRTFYNWRSHHNIVQSVNLAIGLILIIMTLILLILGTRVGSSDSPMNIYMLGVCGGLSSWAGMTENKRIVYIIDMLIGLLLISSSTSIAIFKDDPIRADVIIGILTGPLFLIIAYQARNFWRLSKIEKNELIEDFEP